MLGHEGRESEKISGNFFSKRSLHQPITTPTIPAIIKIHPPDFQNPIEKKNTNHKLTITPKSATKSRSWR
jgi:hypothetical protein